MKTENELIAEFMGFVDYGSETFGVILRHPDLMGQYQDHTRKNQHGKAMILEYHTSWDWLMPVVEKILKTTEPITGQGWSYEYKQLADARLGYPIKSVYQLVVNFIKWYNENKQP